MPHLEENVTSLIDGLSPLASEVVNQLERAAVLSDSNARLGLIEEILSLLMDDCEVDGEKVRAYQVVSPELEKYQSASLDSAVQALVSCPAFSAVFTLAFHHSVIMTRKVLDLTTTNLLRKGASRLFWADTDSNGMVFFPLFKFAVEVTNEHVAKISLGPNGHALQDTDMMVFRFSLHYLDKPGIEEMVKNIGKRWQKDSDVRRNVQNQDALDDHPWDAFTEQAIIFLKEVSTESSKIKALNTLSEVLLPAMPTLHPRVTAHLIQQLHNMATFAEESRRVRVATRACRDTLFPDGKFARQLVTFFFRMLTTEWPQSVIHHSSVFINETSATLQTKVDRAREILHDPRAQIWIFISSFASSLSPFRVAVGSANFVKNRVRDYFFVILGLIVMFFPAWFRESIRPIVERRKAKVKEL